jgi:hypothetical protein
VQIAQKNKATQHQNVSNITTAEMEQQNIEKRFILQIKH